MQHFGCKQIYRSARVSALLDPAWRYRHGRCVGMQDLADVAAHDFDGDGKEDDAKYTPENGQILIDSSDIIYMFDTAEDGSYFVPADSYYGELTFTISYKNSICIIQFCIINK